jgi:excisionase family DNA binding protein
MSTTRIISEHRPEVQALAFSIGQTATILNVSQISVRRLIARGLLRPNRTLRHLRISQAEINRFLEQR